MCSVWCQTSGSTLNGSECEAANEKLYGTNVRQIMQLRTFKLRFFLLALWLSGSGSFPFTIVKHAICMTDNGVVVNPPARAMRHTQQHNAFTNVDDYRFPNSIQCWQQQKKRRNLMLLLAHNSQMATKLFTILPFVPNCNMRTRNASQAKNWFLGFEMSTHLVNHSFGVAKNEMRTSSSTRRRVGS